MQQQTPKKTWKGGGLWVSIYPLLVCSWNRSICHADYEYLEVLVWHDSTKVVSSSILKQSQSFNSDGGVAARMNRAPEPIGYIPPQPGLEDALQYATQIFNFVSLNWATILLRAFAMHCYRAVILKSFRTQANQCLLENICQIHRSFHPQRQYVSPKLVQTLFHRS